MKFAHDLPGYAQGHRFSSAPEFFDSANQRFHDLAGYNRFGNHVEKLNGTPVFAARGSNARDGLYLDNTNHWQFPNMTPWHGSGLIVAEFNTLEGATSGNMFPWIFGTSSVGNITNDPLLWVQYNFGSRKFYVWGPASQLVQSLDIPDSPDLCIIAWSRNQEDRKSRYTLDGTTVTASAAFNTGETNGNSIAMGSAGVVRMGNLNGSQGDVATSATGTMHLFEQHFWKGDVLRDNLPELKDFIGTLKSHYGIV